jgi:ERCC4-related helicase
VYNPEFVVGHGGFDGMSWFGEQEAALAAFRAGTCRLLVATSVLEEGLDVAECDLVVRLQGVQSLIG